MYEPKDILSAPASRRWPRPIIHTYNSPIGADEHPDDVDYENPTISTTNVIDNASSRFIQDWRPDGNRRVLARGPTKHDGRLLSKEEMLEEWRAKVTRNEFDGLAVDEFGDPTRYLGEAQARLHVAMWIDTVETFINEFPEKSFVPWVTIGGRRGRPHVMRPHMRPLFELFLELCPYIILEWYAVLADFPKFDDHGAGEEKFRNAFTGTIDVWHENIPRGTKHLVIGLNLLTEAEPNTHTRRRELKFIKAIIQTAYRERRLWGGGTPAGIALWKPAHREKSELVQINRELQRYVDQRYVDGYGSAASAAVEPSQFVPLMPDGSLGIGSLKGDIRHE